MATDLNFHRLRSTLEEAADEVRSVAAQLEQAVDELGKMPEEGPNIVGDGVPPESERTTEQRDLVEALLACGERAGV